MLHPATSDWVSVLQKSEELRGGWMSSFSTRKNKTGERTDRDDDRDKDESDGDVGVNDDY